MNGEPAMQRVEELEQLIASLGSVVVAFSGGIDSTLVAALSVRALGHHALAVTAVSPSLASGELDGAVEVARALGVRHRTISTAELAREGYRANGPDRCYHCKSELYDRLAALARVEGYAALLSGTNADDLGDWRPGIQAATEHGVRHPLLELCVGKSDVRLLARTLGLPNSAKPASPCLASRVPHGTAVDARILAQIDRAELAVKALGYRVLRVRHFGDRARVEFGGDELQRALAHREEIVDAIRSAGYGAALVHPHPFRSGSLTRMFQTARPSGEPVPVSSPGPLERETSGRSGWTVTPGEPQGES